MIDERCGSSFTVATSNANHLSVSVSAREFYFRNHRNTQVFQFDYHGCVVRNAWAFDSFVSIQNQRFRMLAFFPFYASFYQHVLIFVFNHRHVGYEYFKTFFLC